MEVFSPKHCTLLTEDERNLPSRYCFKQARPLYLMYVESRWHYLGLTCSLHSWKEAKYIEISLVNTHSHMRVSSSYNAEIWRILHHEPLLWAFWLFGHRHYLDHLKDFLGITNIHTKPSRAGRFLLGRAQFFHLLLEIHVSPCINDFISHHFLFSSSQWKSVREAHTVPSHMLNNPVPTQWGCAALEAQASAESSDNFISSVFSEQNG